MVFGGASSAGGALASGLKPGALHVSMSTISPALSSRLAEEHARRGRNYVAAPVFAILTPPRRVSFTSSRPENPTRSSAAVPIFDLVGQRIFVVGSDPASANLVKLAGNSMIATSLEVLGEVLAPLRSAASQPKTSSTS